MFSTARSRYILRAAVAAALASLSVAATVWIDNPYVQMAGAGGAVLGAYLGIGAAVPQVEPSVGRKL